jgi:prepilin-type N-terminal cleavage/methylation domain-containing protein
MMKRSISGYCQGFTLVEVLVSLAVGLMVVGAAVAIFSKALDVTFAAQHQSEVQQDARAASNLMHQDISLAGAGIPPGGILLASGTGRSPRYGCDQNQCYAGPQGNNGAGVGFPNKRLYGIIPGFQQGITINGQRTDIITLVYSDNQLQMNCYAVNFPVPDGTQIGFTGNCPQSLGDQVSGLKAGDLILFENTTAGNTAYAVGEVTADVLGNAGPYVVNFANNDSLLINQIGATSGDLAQITGGVNTVASRIYAITYYLDLCTAACGSPGGIPRLMRMIGGHPPQPVADNVLNLQFTYDAYDQNGNLLSASGDAGASVGVSPNSIRNVNITHLTLRTSQRGRNGYQGTDIQTSISARNMSFQNRYQ